MRWQELDLEKVADIGLSSSKASWRLSEEMYVRCKVVGAWSAEEILRKYGGPHSSKPEYEYLLPLEQSLPSVNMSRDLRLELVQEGFNGLTAKALTEGLVHRIFRMIRTKKLDSREFARFQEQRRQSDSGIHRANLPKSWSEKFI